MRRVIDRTLAWRIAIGWGVGLFVGACLGTVMEMTAPTSRSAGWFVLGAVLGFLGLVVYVMAVSTSTVEKETEGR